MHAASDTKSRRLSRTLSILKAHGRRGVTGSEIQSWTGSLAVGTDVSELRNGRGGHIIPPAVYERTTDKGRKVYRYFYHGKA